MSLTLSQARAIIDAALTQARTDGAQPLAIVVLDAGAHPVATVREDGASLFRFDIAKAKASGALGMGADTRVIASRAASNPVFFQSVVAATGGRLALSPGGVLIRDVEGTVIGAVGISGDTGDCDEACALAGIMAAGLSHGDVK
ncbi:GlcG/HbpS family heme-binding protein [Sphingobium sp. CAP-1]|uniref:GlcG/HbpS family heme-binding protein n=1 Tax=Sphingobium sp. CAP-1 TaxID=2676077 RepID=UPI0012BB3CB0|nr:heme-binding protein [Sphingobium sp. CAP-1]QGP78012.1 heme-binding protein [Sphingobium sp. CAP-1]